MNALDNTLYSVYSSTKTSKELWDSLEKKYKTEDASLKKFILGRYLEYKMVDSKNVLEQVQELQLIMHDMTAECMKMTESMQVASIIEKLPPKWKNFKNYHKHKRKEMGLENLIVRLRIEEDNRISDHKLDKPSMEAKANLAESNNSKEETQIHPEEERLEGPKKDQRRMLQLRQNRAHGERLLQTEEE